MKSRGQVMPADGFDMNVAEKMPKIKRIEEPFPSPSEENLHLLEEDRQKSVAEMRSREEQAEEKAIFESLKKGIETEKSLDVLKLIEDLHAQLHAAAQTKRALEMDLTSHKQTAHQLAQDNQELRRQLQALSKEHQRLKEFQSESIYL